MTRRQALHTIALTTTAAALAPTLVRAQAPAAPKGPFTLPPLGYPFDALEPHIDAQTMQLHHDKHHQTYVDKLNTAIAKAPALGTKPIDDLLAKLDDVPEDIRKDLRNHGGGHANHSLFWQTLKKNDGAKPAGELAKAIDTAFGSFSKWQDTFSDAAMKVFGSGWAWLVWRGGKLVIESTPNQDSPLSTGGAPLLGIDVWEHAYYLKYQNRRAEYVKAFQSVIHWDFVSARFAKLAK